MIYPHNLEAKIGFDVIRSILIQSCNSELGQEHIDALCFTDSYDLIHKALSETKELLMIIDEDLDFPTPSFVHIQPILAQLKTEGTYIPLEYIPRLIRSLTDIAHLCSFFTAHKEQTPFLFQRTETIYIPRDIITACAAIIDQTGAMKDSASPELQQIRRKIREKKQSLHQKIAQVLKKARQEGWTESDSEATLRNGRLVIPVLQNHKRKIKGLVHDESATGKTFFVEPAETFTIHNDIANLEYAEQREIISILREIATRIRPFIPQIEYAYDFLGFMDGLLAKTKLAQRLSATMPLLVTHQTIDIYGARHPLLHISYENSQKTVVPLRILLNAEQRIIILSGPNAGGKSVCMKSVMLLQYMLQCGLLIPCEEQSTVGIFSRMFADIGDEQSLENDLSTYSSHLSNMKYMLEHACDKTLVCIDEFGTGTEPLLGGAIAESILETMHDRGVYGLITTHYTNLKYLAESLEYAINGAMLFDSEQMRPLFKLRMGKPGSSFAFEIAETIGIPGNVIQRAKDKLGKKHIDFEENLKKLEQEKQYVFAQKQKLATQKNDVLAKQKELNEGLEKISKKRHEILSDAEQQMKQLITDTNRRLEAAIREIKETQANKEKTKEIRAKLIESQQKDLAVLQKTISGTQGKPGVQNDAGQIQVGSFVTMKNQSVVGEVVHISKKTVQVQFGNVRSFVKLSDLHLSTKKPEKQQKTSYVRADSELQEKQRNFSPKIDIRGVRGQEALYRIQDFVEIGHTLGVSRLEILHGKGYGILREMIRNYLAHVHFVVSYEDAPIDMGGDGITIVRL